MASRRGLRGPDDRAPAGVGRAPVPPGRGPHRSDDPRIHERLVLRYLPMVRRIAIRYAGLDADLEDLVQAGTIGFLNALRRYEPDRRVPFEAYACRYIAGEIQHSLRDGAIYRLPRWLPHLYRELTAAAAVLHRELGRTPTVAEIGARMNLRESGVVEILRAYQRAHVYPAGDLLSQDTRAITTTSADRKDHGGVRREAIVHQHYVTFQLPIEDRILILDVVGRLAETQKKIVYYLFYMDLSQSEVAKRLRLPPRQVSRFLAGALKRLAVLLRPAGGDEPAVSPTR